TDHRLLPMATAAAGLNSTELVLAIHANARYCGRGTDIGLMIRDQRSGSNPGRRGAPTRGSERVTAPAQRSWPRLGMPSLQGLRGSGRRLQQLLWPLLLVLLGMGLYELVDRLQPLAQRPISVINVEGDLQYIDRASVQAALAPYQQKSLVTIDLDALRADLLAMPWVSGAS